jgi:hypothetical protein
VFEQQVRATVPGMACWALGGPLGATCGQCIFFGYSKPTRRTIKHVQACAKFHELTGKHGAVIPANTPSCRYFQRKAEEK